MRKLGLRAVKKLAQGHTPGGADLYPYSFSPESVLSVCTHTYKKRDG